MFFHLLFRIVNKSRYKTHETSHGICWAPQHQSPSLVDPQGLSWERMVWISELPSGINITGYILFSKRKHVILLMEEIPNNHLGCMKHCDKLPTSTGAGFQPSTIFVPRKKNLSLLQRNKKGKNNRSVSNHLQHINPLNHTWTNEVLKNIWEKRPVECHHSERCPIIGSKGMLSNQQKKHLNTTWPPTNHNTTTPQPPNQHEIATIFNHEPLSKQGKQATILIPSPNKSSHLTWKRCKLSTETSMFSFHISFIFLPYNTCNPFGKKSSQRKPSSIFRIKKWKNCWFQPLPNPGIISNNQDVCQVWLFPSLGSRIVCLTIHLGQKHVVRQLLCKGLKPPEKSTRSTKLAHHGINNECE